MKYNDAERCSTKPIRMNDNRRQFLKTVGAAAIGSTPTLLAETRQLKLSTPEGTYFVLDRRPASFTIKLIVDFKKFDGEKNILEISQILRVRLRQHDPHDRKRQNYPAFQMPDGSVPVLEATLMLQSTEHPDWNEMTIGIPLAMLKQAEGKHEVVLNFSGVRWSMYIDNELCDNDFPFGYPPLAGAQTWKLNAEYVTKAVIHTPGLRIKAKHLPTPISSAEIQYWLPAGHNSWVGDVVTFFHLGRYHVFYLYDRRHHQSKFGKGAHYFEHLSTTDFRIWTEHPAATPLEKQWECIGTGTPFVFEKKLHLSYGLHTGRIYTDDKTTWPAQWDYLKKNGRTGSFARNTPGIPAGATYAVSADGVSNFKKSHITFHPCQNPSVYLDPSGQLRLLANAGSKGIWKSDTIDGGWRCLSPNFPPGGDCTFFFRWGRFDYIIGGFKNLWSKPADAPDSAYEDIAAKGLDFYDGSNVPSITEITGGRFLMAAWIPIRGWGGNLLIRELLQFPDGRIGSKWMPEISPQTDNPGILAASISTQTKFPLNGKSFLLTFDVHLDEAKQGKCSVSFLPQNGEQDACEFQLRLNDARAQFAPASLQDFAAPQKSLREGNSPHEARNYAIENLIGVDQRFTVRILVKHSDKIGGSLVDAEIAGQRTMISYRPELSVQHLLFRTENLSLTNVQIAPLTRAS